MSDVAPVRRVLVLVDQYIDPYGGTEGQIHALLAGLPPTWQAEMWVLQPSDWLKRHDFPCPVRNLGLNALARPTALVRMGGLALELKRRRFDLVQTYMNDASIAGPLIATAAGIPCFLARRDLGFWQTPRLRHVLRRTDRLADGVIANCGAVKDHTVIAEHVPPGLVHVIANGHDPRRFDVEAEPGLRDRLGIPADAPLVGLLANIKPLKRHDDLLDALVSLRDAHPDVHALLIGEPVAPGPSIASRARERGLADRVHEVLAPGNAIPLLRHLDIGVLCSETEGLSNAVIEYMGCGLPVVATRVGGNPDLVEDGENGYLYEIGDVDALAARLGELLADGALRDRLGAASKQRFFEQFTLDRMVTETTRRWEAAVAPRRGGATTVQLAWGVMDDRAALERLTGPWDALLRRGQLFLGPDWMLAWLEHGAPSARPHVITAHDANGRLVGLLPLVERGSVLAFPGQGEGADHLDVVAAPGFEETVARGALGLAFLHDLGGRLRLLHLAEDGALRTAIHAAGRRLSFGEMRSTSCPYTTVDGRRWDDYVKAQFSYAARRNLRRYPRRFRKLDGAVVERVTSPKDAADGIDRFLALHDRRFESLSETSALSDDSIRAFHRDLAERMARRGRLALTFLKLGDRDVACEYGFRHEEKLYAFQSGFVGNAGFESPGVVLQAIVMEEDVFGEGLVEYDFLDGTEDYKRRWATGERRLYDVEIHGLTKRARLFGMTKGSLRLTHDLLFRSS